MGLGSFSVDLSKFGKKAIDNYDAIVKKAILDIVSPIIEITPVDTGRAKGGWQVDKELGTGQTGILDKEGSVTIARCRAAIQNLDTKAKVIGYIFNNVVYITALEDGHSGQAPMGMVKVTILRWINNINKAAAAL